MEPEAEPAKLYADSIGVLCGICNEFYQGGDNVLSTPGCGHVFHKECIHSWLNRSRTCPQCYATCQRHRLQRIHLNFAERTEPHSMERPYYEWVALDMHNDVNDPINTLQCGTDHEGFDTFVARAYLHHDLLPANYVPEKKFVYAPWACSAHRINEDIDILVLNDSDIKWVPAEKGYVPPNALQAGYSESRESLYTGRTVDQDKTILGKVHPSHKLLYYPYGREERSSSKYDVLVVTPKDLAER